MRHTVHFVFHPSAAGSLRQAFPESHVACLLEPHTRGPCRFDDDADGWLQARCRWWQEWAETGDDILRWAGGDEPLRWDAMVAELETAIVWAADAVAEQIMACWLAETLPIGVRLRCARPENPWKDRYEYNRVASTRSEYLAATESRPVTDMERAQLRALWRAFLEPTPERFFALARENAGRPLANSLHWLLSRFPEKRDGLTFWERTLLAALAAPKSRNHLFRSIADGAYALDRPDHPEEPELADYFYELEGDGLLSHERRAAAYFYFTDSGRRVLEGEANRVDLVGFDRWFGGTRIWSDDTMWWRDGDKVLSG